MTRKVQGTEAQLDADLLRGVASTLTKLNALREFSSEFTDGEEDTSVRVGMPAELAVTSAGNTVGTVRRRADGTWYLSAVIAE